MTLSRFTLWEWAIGGASAVAFLIVTAAPLRTTFLALLAIAFAAAVLARHILAVVGTFVVIWVALPLWAPVIPGAEGLPTVGAVIETPTTSNNPPSEPTASTSSSPSSSSSSDTGTGTEPGPVAGAEAATGPAPGAGTAPDVASVESVQPGGFGGGLGGEAAG